MADLKRRLEAIARHPRFLRRLHDARPITPGEERLYALVRTQLAQACARKYHWSGPEAEEMIGHWEGMLGRRGLLKLLLEPPPVLGIPRDCFLVNLLACLGIYAYTLSVAALATGAILLHVAALYYYVVRRPRMIMRKVAAIEQKGLSI